MTECNGMFLCRKPKLMKIAGGMHLRGATKAPHPVIVTSSLIHFLSHIHSCTYCGKCSVNNMIMQLKPA